jgi:hypothetical protein
MLKLITPIAIGLLTVISIAPKSEAIPINLNSVSFGIPGGDSHSQVVIKIGGQPDYADRRQSLRRREFELQQQRQSERRRYRYHSQHDRIDEYRGEYRRARW